ncbi:type 1 fimbria chaperone FimC [Salmonella enterica subsp. houtenae]|uniref:Molecular chaperone FimC n=2 Tax=Salmonella enterica TaxID=28901 RepID=A0A3J3C1X7_SALER|nr:molecular chaperone FimC [Salmonella enterica]EBH8100874.1 molecular chaperone FimC [Salmonella enterica subsp. houtenae serovar O:11:g,z25:-]ECC8716511.1 molecular chaperone FimC [Salmonella enterica subsp. houtenae]ECU4766915.1 molecular chaperone FimC [Salmonella enterica subsp. enterica]EDQ1015485.1 type 1 fimbria chaperone FimC [Salmonella enterica subsp. houtenae serovar 50:z4,z23:-]EDW0438287.1 type 1 fimbria chaperone FimC [Salmonella enterica subsp. arizonae serovar 50:z4,z23:-]EE
MLNIIKLGLILLALFTSLNAQAAGGIALGATRVIYPSEAKQTSLAISNSDTKERYLVNSWIENSAGQKEKTFIVTPPLFVSEPKSENTLRIIYAGQPLPVDRESLFWMNVKAIPSVDKSHIEGKNVLQLAILSRIKLFVRPANLPQTPEEAPALLKFSRVGNHLKITNPSAYYLTLVNISVGAKKIDNVMIAPKSDVQVSLPADAQGRVTFQTVNDYGALTTTTTASLG